MPMLLLLALAAMPLRGQETVAKIRESAFRHYTGGQFAEALPYFEQLIEIQGSSQSSQVQAGMERVFFNAAMCQFLTGNFTASGTAFVRYNKKYPRGTYLHESYVYIADAQRFSGQLNQAIKSYEAALRRFTYPVDLRTDIYSAIARCYLAEGDWSRAREPLHKAFESAPDSLRRGRAATLLATAYLKTLELDQIYPMVPYLLTRNSLATRSIAFNMAAIEAGDELFQEERYREAFWIHRLVYPYDEVQARTEIFLEELQRMVTEAQQSVPDPRRIMRLQEWVADTEAELQALSEQVENYDPDLHYRIARGYMEARRYREGCHLFLYLNRTGGEAHAEEALYLAFICAANVPPRSRAYGIARRYMDVYPGGEWYDALTLTAGQMYAGETNWTEVIRHFSEVLQVKPGHQAAAECLYLLGYAHFMEEQFEQTRVRMLDLQLEQRVRVQLQVLHPHPVRGQGHHHGRFQPAGVPVAVAQGLGPALGRPELPDRQQGDEHLGKSRVAAQHQPQGVLKRARVFAAAVAEQEIEVAEPLAGQREQGVADHQRHDRRRDIDGARQFATGEAVGQQRGDK